MTITGLSQRLHGDSAHPRWRDRLASCGYPRSGVLVRVVDEDEREVPPGEIGEPNASKSSPRRLAIET